MTNNKAKYKMGLYKDGKLVKAFDNAYDAYEYAVVDYSETKEAGEVKYIRKLQKSENVITSITVKHVKKRSFWGMLKSLLKR